MNKLFSSLICLCLFLSLVGAVSASSSSETEPTPAGVWLGLAEAKFGPIRFDVDLGFEGGSLSGELVLVDEDGMVLAALMAAPME